MPAPFAPLVNTTAAEHCEQNVGIDYSRDLTFKLTLESFYFLAFIIAIVQLVRIRRRDPLKRPTPQLFFHLLIACTFFLRLVLIPLPSRTYAELSIFWNFVVQTLPAVFYFASYVLLFFYWAAVYYRAVRLFSRSYQKRILVYYVCCNVLAFVALFVVAAVLQSREDTTYSRMTHVSSLFIAIMSLSIALLALVYGFRVYLQLRSYPVVSTLGRQNIRRVSLVTAICCSAFLAKAPLVVYINSHLCQDDEVSYDTYQCIYCAYLFLVDIVPAMLVLYLIRAPPPARLGDHGKHQADENGLRGNGKTDYGDERHRRRTSTASKAGKDVSLRAAASTNFDDLDPLYLSFTLTPAERSPLLGQQGDADSPPESVAKSMPSGRVNVLLSSSDEEAGAFSASGAEDGSDGPITMPTHPSRHRNMSRSAPVDGILVHTIDDEEASRRNQQNLIL